MADTLLGRVVWYELLTNDVKAAKAFYAAVVGWTAVPFKGAQEGYGVWMRSADVGVGGVMAIPEGLQVPPHWGMYIGTPTLEETVAQIEARGGSALSAPADVPDVGRMRTMKDPQGAAFSLLQPAMHGSIEDTKPEIGDASWHELYTTDAKAALTFYTDVFGWKPTESMDMGAMGAYHMFARGARLGGGMMNTPKERANVPPCWNFYFRVPDVHAAAGRVKANGGTVLNGPMEVPGGDWAVNCMDPQGAAFSMHHTK
jgi:uncharacterized protein